MNRRIRIYDGWRSDFLALTFTAIRANSADYKLVISFLFFPVNRIWYFMQIVSSRDNFNKMSNSVF